MADIATPAVLDPVTLAILSNRLWIINDEAAATVRRVSGSPVATEICDFNTSLLCANGDGFMVGAYFGFLSSGHEFIVKNILAKYSENPGINEDDMFICSDPYSGNTHQNDVSLLAPVFFEGACIAWTGVSIHQVDVGGPVPGSQASIGATSIYQEALPIPPLKIVEGGLLRKDIEEEYLIRSRTRDLVALDLRAKIAANNRAKSRLLECADQYGVDTLLTAMDAIVDRTEDQLRRRLEELPDGTWRHRAYMDEAPGVTHRFELAVTKSGNELCFDFTGTGPQTGAIFNCSKGGLTSAVLSSVLPILFYGMRWCPAAARRVLDVRTKPGTLVDAIWPAGMCKATTGAMAMANTVSNVCLGKMLSAAADPETSGRAMAPWLAASPVQELGGIDEAGRAFGATMLDPMAGGGGAHADSDGVDNASVIRAMKLRIANVETYEFRYPLLFLHRRRLEDSAGAGTYRGGVGLSIALTPHGVENIPTNVMHSINYQVPATAGLLGGYPGATNSMSVLRGSNFNAEVASGRLPTELDELTGELSVIPVMESSYLKRGDIYRSITGGGGGFGDPLWREAEHVMADITSGAVSPAEAEATYGVIRGARGDADPAATAERRAQLLRERLEQAIAPSGEGSSCDPASAERVLTGGFALYRVADALHIGCSCGRLFAPTARNYKEGLAVLEGPLQTAGPLVDPYGLGDAFVYRRFLCPGCGRTMENEVTPRSESALEDIHIGAGGAA